MQHMPLRLLLVALLCLLALATLPAPYSRADHKDNGHSAMLFPSYKEWEMNGRTTNGDSVPIRLVTYDSIWAAQLSLAVAGWNSGLSSLAGFDVFVWDNAQSGFLDIKVQTGMGPQECANPVAHGCFLSWNPSNPSAVIFMYTPYMTISGHKRSDLMHELGHALLTANEHYPGNDTAYNCTSLMGHSANENALAGAYCTTGSVLTTVQTHDLADYGDAFGVEDAPNATFVQIGFGQLIHYFEGGYQGGDGRTIHQEFEYQIRKSTTGVSGSYSAHASPPRKVANEDDALPESHAIDGFPTGTSEWCFKMRGHSKIESSGEWGPDSKRYCISRSGSGTGVFVTSDRNNQAFFRIANFSGTTIVNVQLRSNPPPGTLICNWTSIADGAVSQNCSVNIGGPGFLDVWYDNGWVRKGTIGYD